MIDFARKAEISEQAFRVLIELKNTTDYIESLRIINKIEDIEVAREIIKRKVLNI